MLNWELKSRKAGYPGHYRTLVWVEGKVQNVSDDITAKDIVVGARFVTRNEVPVSINFARKDKIPPRVTWYFKIYCSRDPERVEKAALAPPKD